MSKRNNKTAKKKNKVSVEQGYVYVRATFNNTIVSVTDLSGGVLVWSSTGCQGFKGSRKSTPFAAKIVGEEVMLKASEVGMKSCDVFIRGPGNGRESALRAIAGSSVKVNLIKDVTPLPHNGCKSPKKRRI